MGLLLGLAVAKPIPVKKTPVKPVERLEKPAAPVSNEWGELTVLSNETADVMLDGKRIGFVRLGRSA